MAAAYYNNVSLRKLALQFGRSLKACREVLREKNVCVLPSNGTGARKYTLDQGFFNVIHREEQAYWLGFFSADGNIQGNSIRFELSSLDGKHLKKFLTALKANYPIHCYWHKSQGKYLKSVVVEVNSEQMVCSLNALGVKPRKTSSIKPCPNISGQVDLEAAYWRGWVDGDGWISYYLPDGTYKGICNIGLVGNQAVVTGFRDFIVQSLGYRNSIHFNPNNSCYILSYSGVKAKKVAQLLYRNATVYLDRKMEKARKMIASLDEI